MQLAIFSDLDDTWFQTAPKCGGLTDNTVAALDRLGQALSFHKPVQHALLKLLHPAATHFIPVTGRNGEALARVVSPTWTDWAITSHGAWVLQAGGQPDAAWQAYLAPHLAVWIPHLTAFAAEAQPLAAHHAGRARLILDQALPVYVSCKGEAAYLDAVEAQLTAPWQALGGQVHRNGHNLALLPPFANKATAVHFLMQRLRQAGEWVFLGLGDSLTDLPFLQLCDFALVPQASQIQQRAWSAAHG